MTESIFNYLSDGCFFRFPPISMPPGARAHAFRFGSFNKQRHRSWRRGLEDTVFYIYNRLIAAKRSRRRAANSWDQRRGVHERSLDRQRKLAGLCGHLDTRHKTQRRCACANRGDFRNPGALATLAATWHVVNRRWKQLINDLERRTRAKNLLLQTLLAPGP